MHGDQLKPPSVADDDDNVPLDDDDTKHAPPDAGAVEIITGSECRGSVPPSSIATATTVEVHPITIRKTPKFPTRERHLAIRRKKATVPVERHHQQEVVVGKSANNRRRWQWFACLCGVPDENYKTGGCQERFIGSGE